MTLLAFPCEICVDGRMLDDARSGVTNTVLIGGLVAEPGRQRLSLGRERLLDAIARAGGPNGAQADPTGIFVFRYVPDPAARKGERPVIYRIDMMKPSSYFLAQRFMMRDKDVVYIASARFNKTRQLVEVVNMLFSPVLQGAALSNAANQN